MGAACASIAGRWFSDLRPPPNAHIAAAEVRQSLCISDILAVGEGVQSRSFGKFPSVFKKKNTVCVQMCLCNLFTWL